jgi:hypothetical protein
MPVVFALFGQVVVHLAAADHHAFDLVGLDVIGLRNDGICIRCE